MICPVWSGLNQADSITTYRKEIIADIFFLVDDVYLMGDYVGIGGTKKMVETYP